MVVGCMCLGGFGEVCRVIEVIYGFVEFYR